MDVKEGKAYPMMPALHHRKKAHGCCEYGWLGSSDKRNQKERRERQ